MRAHPGLLSAFTALVAFAAPARAQLEMATPPPRFPQARPVAEVTSWLAPGGGVRTDGAQTRGVFDLRAGGSATFAMGRRGDDRVGPFVEVASATFASVSAIAGAELFFGALPRPLRMFYYSGEGTLSLRLGAGWTWRDAPPGPTSSPLASVTVAYGYRAPFSLREYTDAWSDAPDTRAPARYMVGARLWVNTTMDLVAPLAWQFTAGIEFEPVGAFRYLFGVY